VSDHKLKPLTSLSRALWHVAPGISEIRETHLPSLKPGHVRVRALWSALSRGTERLVTSGAVPESEWTRMRAPFQEGDFPFPIKYGYCLVGRLEAGPSHRLGQTVFALHPHQTLFDVPEESAVAVPTTVTPRRAVLAANMETALNAVWDSAAGPGDRILVVGAGVVGLLIAWLCARMPGADVLLIDQAPERAAVASALGLKFALSPVGSDPLDIAFNCTGRSEGLAVAIGQAGFEATIVEASWHGAQDSLVPLGGAFHSQRLRLISSQVGAVASSRRARWSYGRRIAKALELLEDPALDALLAASVNFDDLPSILAGLLDANSSAQCPLICYPAARA
jgi:threonine dehydrogenase-like Zn-dependent dehydrogenase